MLLPTPTPLSSRRAARERAKRPLAPPPALTLTAAALTFDAEDDPFVTLAFDRAIDVSGLVPAAVTVGDPSGAGWAYAGTAVHARPDPRTVVLAMIQTGPAEGPGGLTASAATGIAATDDGEPWPGATDLPLPFG